jgi:prophage tail gpP-like protein
VGTEGKSTTSGGSVTGAAWQPSQYFDRIERPPYLGRCVVYINGQEYYEWETVQVKLSITENPRYSFRLTVSEQEPWPEAFAFMRIMPPDKCAVYLDGFQVIRGIVITRQVYYDAGQHTVEIQGAGYSEVMSRGAFVSQTGEFKDKSMMDIARSAASPYGVGVQSQGNVPQDKFDRFSIQPGERAMDAVERAARQMGVFLTSNPAGELVLLGSDGFANVGDNLVEGVNILTGHEIIHSVMAASGYAAESQKGGSDDEWGPKVTHQLHTEQGGGGFSPDFMPQRVLSEHPSGSLDMLKKRVKMEKDADDLNQIWATITHLGWRTPSQSALWIPGQTVVIDAPMLVLHNKPLRLKTVTFTLDNQSGTRATLELFNRAAETGQKPEPTGEQMA